MAFPRIYHRIIASLQKGLSFHIMIADLPVFRPWCRTGDDRGVQMRRCLVYVLMVSVILTTLSIHYGSTELSIGEPTRALPTPPTNFTVVPGNAEVRLSWEDPETFNGQRNGFNLYRSRTPEFGPEAYANLAKYQFSYRDTNVVNGNIYYYAVAAINLEDGTGELTEPTEAKPVGRPTAPRNATATHGSGQVYLTWLPPEEDGGSPVIGYSLLRGVSSSALDTRINVSNVTSHIDNEVVNGVPYIYRILAFNERLDGYKSDEIQVTPRGTPEAPGNLTAKGLGREVLLNWTYPEDDGGTSVTGYTIYRGSSEEDLERYAVLDVRESYLDDNITCGNTYYYSIAAMNSEGNGTMSGAVSVTPYAVPDPPSNLTIEPRDRAAFLTWRAPEDHGGKEIQGYNLYRTLKGLEMEFIYDMENVLQYTDTDLTNDVTYYYQIKAYNVIGEGLPSKTVSVKPGDAPKPPGNFRLKEEDSRINILWTKPQMELDYPVQEFIIYRGLQEDDLEVFQIIPVSASSYIDEDVEIGETYYYSIRSVSRVGEGDMSGVISGIPFASPGTVRELDVTGGNKKVTLSWEPPEDNGGREIIKYLILRGDSPEKMSTISTVDGNTTKYVDDKVDNGNRYFYGVKAINEELDGEATEGVEVFPLGPPTAPKNVDSIPLEDAIMVTWNPPISNGGRPIQGYKILRGSSDLDLKEIDSVGLVQNYTDSSIEKGEEYYYSVKAYNEIGESTPSRSTIAMIYLPPQEEDKGGIDPLLMVLASVIVVLIFIGMVAAMMVAAKKKKEEEMAEEEELEESEMEKEKKMVEELRARSSEYTDVSLTSDEAHAHDRDGNATPYEELYGSSVGIDQAPQEDPDSGSPPTPEIALPEEQGADASPTPEVTGEQEASKEGSAEPQS